MSILVINAGSSSVKFGLFRFDDLEPVARGLLDWAGNADRATVTLRPEHGEAVCRQIEVADYRSGVEAALGMLQESGPVEPGSAETGRGIRVVGHRLIHGGEEIRRPVRIDAAMKRTIAQYTHLAPLHIPAGLQAIEATESSLPGVPQVGLFDTAFFAHIPQCDYIYPLPYEWYRDWGIRRYGFHGTSHAYCTARATEMLHSTDTPQPRDDLRLVICHLGQGSSAAAVRGGRAITNTMGFTPLEGFPMGTRCGTVDPGVLLYVLREKGVSVEQLDEVLHKRSGLLGISGVSADFRQVETAAAEGHERAQLALDVYAHRVKTTIGALATALGGLDAVVFTGGIGENSGRLREQVCKGMEWLGVHLDADRNHHCTPDSDVATDASPCRVLVVHTREDLMIARESRRLISQQG